MQKIVRAGRVPLLVLLILAAAPLHAAVTVTIGEKDVTARGLTPGGGAVFFAVAHESHGDYYALSRVEKMVADEDRDGVVVYQSQRAVPWKSVWCVVDLKTGAFAVSSPDGLGDRTANERTSRAVKDSGGATRLEHERDALDILVVRPGGDVWTLEVARGGDADDEKRGNPKFTSALEKFRPLTSGARPLTHLTRADVIIAIDPQLVEMFVVSGE